MAKKNNSNKTAEEQQRQRRHVCFSKRRKGLFHKASELCNKCGSKIAIVMLSEAGKPYAFGHPSTEEVLDRYLTTSQAINPPATSKNDQKQTNYEEEGKGTEMDIKEWIDKEFEACQTVQELKALKIMYTELLENINKKIQDSSSPSSSRGREKERDHDLFGSSSGGQFISCMDGDDTAKKSNFDNVGKNSRDDDSDLDVLNAVPLAIYNPFNDTAYSLDKVFGGGFDDVGMEYSATNQELKDVVRNGSCTEDHHPVSSSFVEPTANSGGGHGESASRVNFQRRLPVPNKKVFVYNQLGSESVPSEVFPTPTSST